METIEDIVREIRFAAKLPNVIDGVESLQLADRIEKAVRHEMSDEFSAEIQKLTDELYEVKKANIRLKAALQPVLDCDVTKESYLAQSEAVWISQRMYKEGEK